MRPKTYDVKFTYEDYLLFPDDGRRHELIDGEHYLTPSPSTRHQRISRNLLTLLHNYLRQAKAGEAFDAPTDVLLSDLDVVQPDLLFISSHRSSIITERCIQGAPDLVVEIVSETTRKESGSQESGLRSQEESLDSESSKQRAESSVGRGRLHPALPVEGDGRSPKIDEVIKRKLYERYGVQEYWIVDPELEIIKVFRMTEQGYVRSAELSNEAKDTLTTPLLPDLQIPLGEIFE